VATSLVSQQINLPSNANPPTVDFDRTNRASYNFSSNLTFINNDGSPETATVYYIKDATTNPESSFNSWQTRLFFGEDEFAPQNNDLLQLLDTAQASIGIRDIEWTNPYNDATLEIKEELKEGPFFVGSVKYSLNEDQNNNSFRLLREDPSGSVHIGNLINRNNGYALSIFSAADKEAIENLENADYLSLTEISALLNSQAIKGMIQAQRTVATEGKLWFDESGKINNASSNLIYDIDGQQITIQRPNTQISSGGFNIFSQEQDGRPDGDLIGIRVETNGDVIASYANGQTNLVGSLRLTTFANPSGLRQIGDTRYLLTEAAGNFNVGIPGTEGFGLVQSGSIERSNVDLTTELVDLIMAQRNFQANSKAIEIDNTMTKSIIDSVRS
jgi:flagellar hook-basal body protein